MCAKVDDMRLIPAVLLAALCASCAPSTEDLPEAKDDGPLWPIMEDALARAYGNPSPKDAREGTPATSAPSRP